MDIVSVLLILLGLLLLAASIIAVIYPLKKTPLNTRKKGLFGIAGSIVTIIIGGALLPPTTDTKPVEQKTATNAAPEPVKSQPKSLKDSDNKIQSVEVSDKTLKIHVHFEVVLDDKSLISDAGFILKTIGNAIKDGAQEAANVENVKVIFTTKVIDKLGNESTATYMTLTFPASDLKAANYTNLTSQMVMNLATNASLSPVGKNAALQYCSKNGQDARAFCLLALSQ